MTKFTTTVADALLDSYRGNMLWLKDNSVFVTKHGSHAYGTSRPDSDLDLKGVFVAPLTYYLGFVSNIEQVDKGFGDEFDATIFELRKFLYLAKDCNPNVIEILFTDPSDHLLVTPIGQKLLDNKELFLSQKCKHTFSGYAVSQLKRIKTHRRWLLDPPTHKPTREEFGLPSDLKIPEHQRKAAESQMLKQVENWDVDFRSVDDATRIDLLNKLAQAHADMNLSLDRQWEAAGRKLGFDDNFLLYLGHERTYHGALINWKQYNEWVATRNAKRAALEKDYGYDTKHGMHLVRLMRMCDEILSGKGVIVKRPDAQELLEIRGGAWTYDKLIEYAEAMEQKLQVLVKSSPLPHASNAGKLDRLCQELVMEFHSLKKG